MTQSVQATVAQAPPPPPAAPAAPAPIDSQRQLLSEFQKDRARLRTIQNPTAPQVAMELDATLLSYVEESMGHSIHHRDEFDQLRGWVGTVIQDMDLRLIALEDEAEPQLTDEFIERLVRACGEAKSMAEAMLEGNPTASTDAKDRLKQHVADLSWLIDYVADDDADDDGAAIQDEAPVG